MSITELTNDALKQMLSENADLQLVDVRMPEEYWYLGHIPQAKLIPLHELPTRFRELNAAQAVAVTCQHGIRSQDACHFLKAQGFQAIYNLTMGMAEWDEPVERDITPLQNLMSTQPKGDA